MSKVNSRQVKKTLSLKKGRHSTYGENSAVIRNGIRRGKQRWHMGERRDVNLILDRLRESAAVDEAIEADVLAETSIVKSKHKTFRKLRDTPLGVVIEGKIAQRARQATTRTIHASHFLRFNVYRAFDIPYNSRFHKHSILNELRYLIAVRGRGRQTEKTQRVRRLEHEDAIRLKEAILRDAPLLKGFFVEEPRWREKALLWCERALLVASDFNNSK